MDQSENRFYREPATEAAIVTGGMSPHRPDAYLDNDLAMAVYSQFGAKMLHDLDLCTEIWCALTNTTWRGRGGAFGYTFRAAGDLIASIRDDGDYLDWYCCGEAGQISDRVRVGMKKAGFEPEVSA